MSVLRKKRDLNLGHKFSLLPEALFRFSLLLRRRRLGKRLGWWTNFCSAIRTDSDGIDEVCFSNVRRRHVPFSRVPTTRLPVLKTDRRRVGPVAVIIARCHNTISVCRESRVNGKWERARRLAASRTYQFRFRTDVPQDEREKECVCVCVWRRNERKTNTFSTRRDRFSGSTIVRVAVGGFLLRPPLVVL